MSRWGVLGFEMSSISIYYTNIIDVGLNGTPLNFSSFIQFGFLDFSKEMHVEPGGGGERGVQTLFYQFFNFLF